MALKTLVKVGSITNLSDARYCAGMGVEMLGFVAVDGAANFINTQIYQEIRGWLSGPSFVAEAYGLRPGSAATILENYAPDFIELSVNDLGHISAENSIPLIVSVENPDDAMSLVSKNNKIAYVVVDPSTASPGFIQMLAEQYPVLLKGDAEKTLTYLSELPVKGITLTGSAEIKPGLKDYDHLSHILEQLEEVD